MKGKNIIILISAVILAILTAFSCVSAQEISLDGLSNEQMLDLLQTIMQKLQEDKTAEPVETPEEPAKPEEPEKPGEPAAAAPETASEEEPVYEIYENKKLLREKLPDSLFVQPEEHKHKEKDEPPSKKKPPVDPPERPYPRG